VSKLSPIKAQKLIRFLKKKGFVEKRQAGSHKFFSHKDGRTTVVPYHTKTEIGKGLLRKILKDTQVNFGVIRKK